jgi:GT2 family glycosyltransferase
LEGDGATLAVRHKDEPDDGPANRYVLLGHRFAAAVLRSPDRKTEELCVPPSSAPSALPLVSIVMPCHLATPAQATLLDETLQTVLDQTCQDYEIILVDDGSPLPVAPGVDARGRITILRQDNAGPALARNAGIARSRGRYLVFLDADDHLLPQALTAGIEALDTHPGAGFAVGPREEMTFEGEPVPWHVPPPPLQAHIYLPLLRFDWYIIPPSSAMFRREVVEAVGGFRDPWGADDLDFYLRVAHRFAACCFQAPAVTRYRRYSTSSSRDGERMLRSIRAVYARQWPLVQGSPGAEAAHRHGLQRLTEIFLDCVVENIEDRLRTGDRIRALESARLLAEECPERWQALLGTSTDAAGLAKALADANLREKGGMVGSLNSSARRESLP